jgi:hypothetical protein
MDNEHLTLLMGQISKLVADIAVAKDKDVGGLTEKLNGLNRELAEILDHIEDIQNQTVPKRDQWPLEGVNRDEIYRQCILIINKKLETLGINEYKEHSYIRWTIMDKDDYGNITDGQMDMNITLYGAYNIYDLKVEFDVIDSYILEPLYIEMNSKKLSFDNFLQAKNEMESYAEDNNIDETDRRTFLDMPYDGGHSVSETDQKEYPLIQESFVPTIVPHTAPMMIDN